MAQLARPADRPFWPVGLSGPTQLLGQMITRRRAFTSPSVLRSSSLSDLSRLEMQGGAAAVPDIASKADGSRNPYFDPRMAVPGAGREPLSRPLQRLPAQRHQPRPSRPLSACCQ